MGPRMNLVPIETILAIAGAAAFLTLLAATMYLTVRKLIDKEDE